MLYYNVLAILPCYTSTGENATRILLSDGTYDTLPIPIKTYIQKMLYQTHHDPKFLQHWTYKVTGCKQNTPITLSDTYIFIPIKARQAVSRFDGSYGYVRSDMIDDHLDYTLLLKGNISLTHLSKKSYTSKKLRDASLLRYAYLEFRKPHENI